MEKRETQQTLNNLRNASEPVEEQALPHLSNLTREEQGWLEEAWEEIAPDKRRRLVALMGERADEDVQLNFSAVFRRGMEDPDAEVRRLSVDGLWEDERVNLIRPFLRLLRSDESPEVRASAASALGRFVLQGEMGYLTEERARELVETLLHIVEERTLPTSVRRRAVESLAYSSDARTRDIIAQTYEDPSPEMRMSAIFAMGRSADEYWAGTVRNELFNEEPAFRYEAARAAGELADKKATTRLIQLLADRDPEVREAAVWALGQIGGPQAREALKQVAQGQYPPATRQLARESLAELDLLDEETPSLFVDPGLYEDVEENVLFDDTEDFDEDEDDEDEDGVDDSEFSDELFDDQ